MPPVAKRVEVAEIEAILKSQVNPCQGPGDLAGNKSFAANRRFMVEENPVAGINAIGFTIVDRNPVGI
jgi:hypothetical protein